MVLLITMRVALMHVHVTNVSTFYAGNGLIVLHPRTLVFVRSAGRNFYFTYSFRFYSIQKLSFTFSWNKN